ncbi:MAG: retropepsin-like aspartic protease [Candidatus Bathyarchaeia archaeon]
MRLTRLKYTIRHIENEDYIFIEGKVLNPLDPSKSEKVEFLVDTGASGCAISEDLAVKLGLEKKGYVDVSLADGSSKRVKAGFILIDLAGKRLYTWTIYDEGFTPILGIDVMKALGFHIDVSEKKVLIPYKGIRIKKLRLFANLKLFNSNSWNF